MRGFTPLGTIGARRHSPSGAHPNEQESVVLLPELERLPHVRPLKPGVVVALDSVRR